MESWMLRWLAPIHLTDHAERQARDRLGFFDPDEVRGEVRLALLEGRVSSRKPNWTRSLGHPGSRREHEVFVWDKAATRCWVLAWTGARIHVLTVLLDGRLEADRQQRLRLRPSMR